jgi:hypothetical protein
MPIGALSPSPVETRFEVCGILGNDRSAHRNARKARISRTIPFVIQRVTELAIALATDHSPARRSRGTLQRAGSVGRILLPIASSREQGE